MADRRWSRVSPSVGMDVVLVGPMPTPAVALLTKAMRADLGVMISQPNTTPMSTTASNCSVPMASNCPTRMKRPIENSHRGRTGEASGLGRIIGRARRVEDARGRYVHAVKSSFPEHLRLDGVLWGGGRLRLRRGL